MGAVLARAGSPWRLARQGNRARIEGQRHIRKAADDEALLEVLAAVREIQQQGRAPLFCPRSQTRRRQSLFSSA